MTHPPTIAFVMGGFGRAEEGHLSGFLRQRQESPYSGRVQTVFVHDAEVGDRVASVVDTFDAAIVDVAAFPRVKAMAEAFAAAEKPTVAIVRGTAGLADYPKLAMLRLDETWIANESVDYLAGNGYRSIAYVGEETPLISEGCSSRRKAMSIRVKEAIGAGGEFRGILLPFGANGELGAEDFGDFCVWLKGLPVPCGLIVDSDALAVTVFDACRQSGLAIPDDISLLGAGNCEELCQSMCPLMSSVEIDNVEGGERAGIVLDAVLGGAMPNSQTSYGVSRVVPRATSRVLESDDARLVVKAQRLIQRYACDGCGVDQIVQMLGVPARTISRKYRSVTGRTMCEDIHRERIAAAKRLLEETDLPTTDVLVSAGYNLVGASYKTFKDITGMSMTEWREHARNKVNLR